MAKDKTRSGFIPTFGWMPVASSVTNYCQFITTHSLLTAN